MPIKAVTGYEPLSEKISGLREIKRAILKDNPRAPSGTANTRTAPPDKTPHATNLQVGTGYGYLRKGAHPSSPA